MSRPDTWMPLYIGDYLRDTGHLSTEEHGAYLLLLMQAWTREGLLPGDDDRIRMLAKMDAKSWKRSRLTIMGFFLEVPGGYRHKRLDHELANSQTLVEQRRAAGKASAEARAKRRSHDDGGGDGDGNGSGQPNDGPTKTQRAYATERATGSQRSLPSLMGGLSENRSKTEREHDCKLEGGTDAGSEALSNEINDRPSASVPTKLPAKTPTDTLRNGHETPDLHLSKKEREESERRNCTETARATRDDFSPRPAHARPARTPQPLMPTLNDDAVAWTHLADGFENDDSGTKRPVVAGSYVDLVAFQVCEAAGIDGHAHAVDWRPLIAWLRENREPPDIVAAIRSVAARANYQPPSFLSYFDRAVRERRAA